jgi:GT2 family glycosyltransferase
MCKMDVPAISISVIVCTRNRLESLRRCVEALISINTAYEWELVVVDNGSNDGTSEFLTSLPKRIGGARLKTVYEPKRGLAAARNAGVRQSNGKIIAFTDDDCYVTKNYIDALIDSFAASPDIGLVGGRISLYDHSDLPITIREGNDYLILKPNTFVSPVAIQGANMAFRREVITRIGGFDELFGAGTGIACEDTDAIAAAIWMGVTGAYNPAVTVYHHHGRKTSSVARALWRTYDRGLGAYYAKYILRRDSRSVYLKHWIKMFQSGLRDSASAKAYFIFARKTFREFSGALYYVLWWLIHRRV